MPGTTSGGASSPDHGQKDFQLSLPALSHWAKVVVERLTAVQLRLEPVRLRAFDNTS